MAMGKVSVFKSAEGADSFFESYNAVLARWPVPYEELNIPTRFGTTHIIASGASDSKPLFLLHGMMGTGAAWLPNVADFSKHYRIYAIDLIGEPNKSEPVGPVKNRREFAEWLVEVFDSLGIDRASIVGNSFGGFLALNQSSHTPDRIEKLVLPLPLPRYGLSIFIYFLHYLVQRNTCTILQNGSNKGYHMIRIVVSYQE
jgi:pimeloyl-ACP methyl ester carboxylesterase